MKLSLNWLQRYIKLDDQKPTDIAELITRRIAEVEGTGTFGLPDSVIVGEILEIKPHPNADRLRLAQVDIGKKKLEIVCGAPNIQVSQKVPVAVIGTVLPGNFKIEARRVRGIASEGMMCAEDELGLGDDHEGILILDPQAKLGSKVSDVLQIKPDSIIEVENKNITHRPDLFSHRGFARELAVIFNRKFNFPKEKKITEGTKKISIKVENPKAVPVYTAIQIDNIQVDKSPSWLQQDLEKIGIKSINNIVDAANYVMSDLGQPLHTFDSSEAPQIVVRFAKKGEKIKALDHQEYKLDDKDIVITDGQKPIAIAGIIGSEDSAVSDKTTSIILESANFDPATVRKTSQKIGLRTDALTRFEKALDPALAKDGLIQLTNLILELCPNAQVVSKIAEVKNYQDPKKEVKFTHDRLEKKVGIKIKVTEVKRILEILGFDPQEKQGKWHIKFPSFRVTKDTGIFEDIAEEVARHIGYENIKPAAAVVLMTAPEFNQEKIIQRKITQILAGAGFVETHNYAFIDKKSLQGIGFTEKEAVRVQNPISLECEFMQPCTIPNMLHVIKNNEREFPDRLKFFTWDRSWKPGKEIKETKKLQIAMAGHKDGFTIIKGLINTILQEIGIPKIEFIAQKTSRPYLLQNSVNINIGSNKIGAITQITDTVIKNFGIRTAPIFTAHLYVEKLLKAIPNEFKHFDPLPEFPATKRDFAFIVDRQTPVGDLIQALHQSAEEIESVEIFDIYTGDKVGKNQKSVALAVKLQSREKTLSDQDIKGITNKILAAIKKIGGTLRV